MAAGGGLSTAEIEPMSDVRSIDGASFRSCHLASWAVLVGRPRRCVMAVGDFVGDFWVKVAFIDMGEERGRALQAAPAISGCLAKMRQFRCRTNYIPRNADTLPQTWPGALGTLSVRTAGVLAAFRFRLSEVQSMAMCMAVIASTSTRCHWRTVCKRGVHRRMQKEHAVMAAPPNPGL